MPGIEEGLEWIEANYKRDGISSLAIPALGCGLGRLKWSEAGPVICGHLASLEIPVRLYLPTDKKIPDEQLTAEFLLRGAA